MQPAGPTSASGNEDDNAVSILLEAAQLVDAENKPPQPYVAYSSAPMAHTLMHGAQGLMAPVGITSSGMDLIGQGMAQGVIVHGQPVQHRAGVDGDFAFANADAASGLPGAGPLHTSAAFQTGQDLGGVGAFGMTSGAGVPLQQPLPLPLPGGVDGPEGSGVKMEGGVAPPLLPPPRTRQPSRKRRNSADSYADLDDGDSDDEDDDMDDDDEDDDDDEVVKPPKKSAKASKAASKPPFAKPARPPSRPAPHALWHGVGPPGASGDAPGTSRSPLAFLSQLPHILSLGGAAALPGMAGPGGMLRPPGLPIGAVPGGFGSFSTLMSDATAPQPPGMFRPPSAPLDPRLVRALQAPPPLPPPPPPLYNPTEPVLRAMVRDFPNELLSHPHLQQAMMLPLLDAAGDLVVDPQRRQPMMVQPGTGFTLPAADGVVPMALLKRSGLRDPDARDTEESVPAVSPSALAFGGAMWQADPELSRRVSDLLGHVSPDTFPWHEAAHLIPRLLSEGAQKWLRLIGADLQRREQSLRDSRQRVANLQGFMRASGLVTHPRHVALDTLLTHFDAALATEGGALEQQSRTAQEADAAITQAPAGEGAQADAHLASPPATMSQGLASAAFLSTAAAAATQRPLRQTYAERRE